MRRLPCSTATRVLGLAMAITLTVAFAGCSKVESEFLATQGMSPDVKVSSQAGGTTTVTATIRTGSGLLRSEVKLTAGDRLEVSAAGETKTMSEIDSLGVTYRTAFNFNQGDLEYVVSLVRPSGTSAPNTRVTSPRPFSIAAPANDTTFSRGDTIDFIWTPIQATARMDLQLQMECQNSAAQRESITVFAPDIEDTGSYSQTVDALLARLQSIVPTRCAITAKLDRSLAGSIDANFAQDGEISAHQERFVTFAIVP